MEISKGIRAKLFFLFIVMGAIPFLILVVFSAINTVNELEDFAKQNSALRNTIISEHVTELIAKNQAVLQSLALNPSIVEYVKSPTEERHGIMEVVVRKAEQIKQIAFNLTVEGKGRVVTASIGIAIAPQNGRDYDTLFASADKAVYHVKSSGKNGYHCELFSTEDEEAD